MITHINSSFLIYLLKLLFISSNIDSVAFSSFKILVFIKKINSFCWFNFDLKAYYMYLIYHEISVAKDFSSFLISKNLQRNFKRPFWSFDASNFVNLQIFLLPLLLALPSCLYFRLYNPELTRRLEESVYIFGRTVSINKKPLR